MVFSHYKRAYSIEFLEQYAQADAEGMSLLGLARLLAHLGDDDNRGVARCGGGDSVLFLGVIQLWRYHHDAAGIGTERYFQGV